MTTGHIIAITVYVTIGVCMGIYDTGTNGLTERFRLSNSWKACTSDPENLKQVILYGIYWLPSILLLWLETAWCRLFDFD